MRIQPITLEEYEIAIQDYKQFNEILHKILLGLRISEATTIKRIISEIEINRDIITRLQLEQNKLLNDMQNSQLTDKRIKSVNRGRKGQTWTNSQE